MTARALLASTHQQSMLRDVADAGEETYAVAAGGMSGPELEACPLALSIGVAALE